MRILIQSHLMQTLIAMYMQALGNLRTTLLAKVQTKLLQGVHYVLQIQIIYHPQLQAPR